MDMIKKVVRSLKSVHRRVYNHAETLDYPYKTLAIFNLVTHPMYHLIWTFYDPQGYQNTAMRISIILISIPLFFKRKLGELAPWWFYIVTTFCFPVFFTFMLLKNDFSFIWALNNLAGAVLCILLLDYKSLAFVMPTGISLACVFYQITGPNPPLDTTYLREIMILYASIFIYGFVFIRGRESSEKSRVKALSSLAAAIAHEMRAPLSKIMVMGKNVEKTTKSLEEKLKGTKIKAQSPLKRLHDLSQKIISVTRRAESLIRNLLITMKQNFDGVEKRDISLDSFFKRLKEDYVFQNNQINKLHVKVPITAKIRGDENTLMHVFFNLLQNSFYFIHSAGKGEIFINVKETRKYVIIIFMDTGPGIEKHNLKNVFQPFYSRRAHGTGVGLSFCKKALEAMGARIRVNSEYGEYTEFKITFPKV